MVVFYVYLLYDFFVVVVYYNIFVFDKVVISVENIYCNKVWILCIYFVIDKVVISVRNIYYIKVWIFCI